MPIDYESAGFNHAFKKEERLVTASALAISATYTAPWIDLGVDRDGDADQGTLIAAYASADASGGTLRIEGSDDGSAVADVIAQVATAQIAGAGAYKANAIGFSRHRYIRTVFVNGANAQTNLNIDRVLVA